MVKMLGGDKMKYLLVALFLAFNGFVFAGDTPCDVDITSYTTNSTAGWQPLGSVNSGDVFYSLTITSQTGAGTAEVGLYDAWESTFTTTPLVYSTHIGTFSAMQRDSYLFNVRLSSGLSYRIVGTNPGLYFGICDLNKFRNPSNSW